MFPLPEQDSSKIDFGCGDASGLAFPAHPEALRTAGIAFLTEAFRQSGAISEVNSVAAIVSMSACEGGSTGQKLFLRVRFATAEPGLDGDLFVKFSRDFTDPIRDLGRWEMASEARFAALARHPAFPVHVPKNFFADFDSRIGTGLIITSRVAYGCNGVEHQLTKCADHKLANPLLYYRTVLTALARLSAAHKSGDLGSAVEDAFPFDAASEIDPDSPVMPEDELEKRLAELSDFAARCPQLLPGPISGQDFLQRFAREAKDVLRCDNEIQRYLHADRDYVALCHWNAQLDNAWFWRDADGELQCGLIDWGNVRQMNLAFALWGCLVGADVSLWTNHLDDLLALFVHEHAKHGGPHLSVVRLRLYLVLYAATIGIAGILIAPSRILARQPKITDAIDARDAIVEESEEVRCFLHILTIFLNLWNSHDLPGSLAEISKK